MSTPSGPAVGSDAVAILYTNRRGETAVRLVWPHYREDGGSAIWHGETEWHPEPQWFLSALDVEKGARRDWALSGIKAWGQEAVDAALASRPAPVSGGGAVTLADLHAANIARQAEWCLDQLPDLSFRGNELAGETGEACNVVKKLERERHGWRGSRATFADLAEELADVVICADLCAITAGIDLAGAVVAKFNATSEKQGLATRLAARPIPDPAPTDVDGADAIPDGLLDFLDGLAENAAPGERHVLNPIIIGRGAESFATKIRAAQRPAPAGATGLDRETVALRNLAVLMREEFVDNDLSNAAKQMVCAALARIWPEDRHTVESCECVRDADLDADEPKCDECPTESQWRAAEAMLDRWLAEHQEAALSRPASPGAVEGARGLRDAALTADHLSAWHRTQMLERADQMSAPAPDAVAGPGGGWLGIETAPVGEEVEVRAGAMTFLAKLVPDGAINTNEHPCDQWQATREGEHPPCWTDGACWTENEDESTSLWPTHWRYPALAAPAASGTGA